MNISPKNLKEIRLVIIFVLISIVLGSALSSLNDGQVSLESIVNGGLMGFCISSICAVGNYAFIYRLRYLPFTAHLLLSTAYYTFVASAVMAVKFILFDHIQRLIALNPQYLCRTSGMTIEPSAC